MLCQVLKFINNLLMLIKNIFQKRCLNLFLCILSCAIDSRDAWSVTQFFDQLCPHVLPCLRRKAQKTSSQLNIMSVGSIICFSFFICLALSSLRY